MVLLSWFHIWLMNLHEMWNEMMKCIECDLVGFLKMYMGSNRIGDDDNALIFLWDWWIYINIDQVNEDIVVACYCDYTCENEMDWLYVQDFIVVKPLGAC
jgi:hypothetical protein